MSPEQAVARLREIAKLRWDEIDPAAVGCEMLELAPLLVEYLGVLEREHAQYEQLGLRVIPPVAEQGEPPMILPSDMVYAAAYVLDGSAQRPLDVRCVRCTAPRVLREGEPAVAIGLCESCSAAESKEGPTP